MALYIKQSEQSENSTTIDFYNEQDLYIGYVTYSLVKNKMLIQNLFIFKEFQGLGLSTPILNTVLSIAKEKRAALIEADIYPRESACLIAEDDFLYSVKMKKLIKLFEANGFEVSPNGEHANGVFRLS